MLTRHVVRGWLFKRVVLEVADPGVFEVEKNTYALHGPWRRATARDLAAIERQESEEEQRLTSQKVFPRGMRVKATNGGFDRGAEGEVLFQEPRGGRVWILRDRAGSPCFYYADEIEQWPRRDFKLWLRRGARSRPIP